MRERFVSVWQRVLSLSWPVMVKQTTRTLMRAVDILVTALFSPVAVAAYLGIGLTYVWMTAVVAGSFHYSGWAERAASMLEARGSIGWPFGGVVRSKR